MPIRKEFYERNKKKEKKLKRNNNLKCDECHSDSVITDNKRAEMICTECGTVFLERLIDEQSAPMSRDHNGVSIAQHAPLRYNSTTLQPKDKRKLGIRRYL